MRLGSLLFILASLCGAKPEMNRIVLAVGLSEVLRLPSLVRATVGNGRVVKVKALPSSALLVTGIRLGRTIVRVWTSPQDERSYEIHVLSPSLYDQAHGNRTENVIRVELEFMELDLAFSRSIGIRWPEILQFSGGGTFSGSMNQSGLNYTVGFASAQGFLHHLVREGWAKVLARPRLSVRLGEEASFHSGGEFPIATSTENYGRTHRHVEWKPFGISVKVRPQSSDGYHFSSDVNVEISEINRSLEIDNVPSLVKRKVDTKTSSKDGETVVLSGLVRQTSSEDEEGIPVLSSIPLLGALFSKRMKAAETSELILTVTFSFMNLSREQTEVREMKDRIHNEPSRN